MHLVGGAREAPHQVEAAAGWVAATRWAEYENYEGIAVFSGNRLSTLE